jgi:multisubunit Na+/H+ antiporter MnhF subunit
VIEVAFVLLGLAMLCFGYRTIAGPNLTDRVTGVSGILVVGMAAVVIHAVDTENGAFLPALVVVALVSFVGTGMIARFIESEGR